MHVLYHFRVATSFPPDCSEISYEELSHRCGLNVVDLRRFLRYAMLQHIFQETENDTVAHTAASKLLCSRYMDAWVGNLTEEIWPGAPKVGVRRNNSGKSSQGKF